MVLTIEKTPVFMAAKPGLPNVETPRYDIRTKLPSPAEDRSERCLSPGEVQDIRSILVGFMEQLHTDLPRQIPFDRDLERGCIKDATEAGLPEEYLNSNGFRYGAKTASAMGCTMFAHLEDQATKAWVCFFTTMVVCAEDLFERDVDPVREFNARYISHQPQLHPVLDVCAACIARTSEHFSTTCASLIVTNALNFFTGIVLEFDHQGSSSVHRDAQNYPKFLRFITGVSLPYALFVFPPHIPLQVYIQTLPDMVDLINHINDLFSFYKEEINGETATYISIVAQMQGRSKITAMGELAQECVEKGLRTQKVLEVCPEAREAFIRSVIIGYVHFHAAARIRYKLDDLALYPVSGGQNIKETVVR